MKLIRIENTNRDKLFNLLKSFEANDNGFENDAFEIKKQDLESYIQSKVDEANGINLPKNYVPQITFILEDKDNYVGIFRLRTKLVWIGTYTPGHVGYGIAKKFRHQGYATKGLKLVLEQAKKLNIQEVYFSVNKNNKNSLRVQLKNNAYLIKQDNDHFYTKIIL